MPLPKLNLEHLSAAGSNNNHELYRNAVRSLDQQRANSEQIGTQQVEMTLEGILIFDKGFEALLFHIAQVTLRYVY